jgi:hypothetical protein
MDEGRDEGSDLAGIPLREAQLSADHQARPWSFRLVVFMRILAVAELCKGLYHWTALLGVFGEPLAQDAMVWRIATVFFSVADLVAAVGLWLGAPWGVVIWLLAAIAQILIAFLAFGAAPATWPVIALILAAMAVYVVLSAKARAENS